MKKYIFSCALLGILKLVIAEDVQIGESRKPEFSSKEDADLNLYEGINASDRTELGQVDDLDITENDNSRTEESNDRSDVNLLLNRSSQEGEHILMETEDGVTINNRRDDKNDKHYQNEDTLRTGKSEDYNGSHMFKNENDNRKQHKKRGQNEYVLEEVYKYSNNKNEFPLSDETDFLEFTKSGKLDISDNTRRKLNPVPLPTLHSREYPTSQALVHNYDINDNIAAAPSILQPLSSPYNLNNSPLHTKLLAGSPLPVINTVLRQNTNVYSSYVPAIINKSNGLNVPPASGEYYSYENKRDGSVENKSKTYIAKTYLPKTPPPPFVNNLHVFGRASDLSHATYRPILDYTQLLKPFNQRYSNLGYGQYLHIHKIST